MSTTCLPCPRLFAVYVQQSGQRYCWHSFVSSLSSAQHIARCLRQASAVPLILERPVGMALPEGPVELGSLGGLLVRDEGEGVKKEP